MAEAVVAFAVERLGDQLIQEASFLHGVSDKVTEIQAELRVMRCFLRDADARQYDSDVIRNWVAEIREAAYDAEDTVETFASKVARRRRGGLQNILKRYACILSEFKALHDVGTEIDAIKSRISLLTAKSQEYNIRRIAEGESSGFRNERPRLPRKTYSHDVEEYTVGVEDSMEILLEQLTKPDKRCSVVSIWGMGGLGKTTLAKKVYHHVRVRRHFDHVVWSSISQSFNIRDVVQGILIQLTSAKEEQKTKIRDMRDEELFESVYKTQEEKKCLVILDDVWEIEDWESLKPAFPQHKAGSKILLTTRIQAVASHADPRGFLYQPKLLSEEQSWELLQMKAFPRGGSTDPAVNNNMELLGKEMVKYCGGLPLAVVVLGGLLATKHTFHEWERVHRNTKSYLRRGKDKYEQQGSGVSDVLTLSYQDLPYQLKPCFLYLGHFPEDQEMSTKTLVRMWVAEGIVSRVEDERLEDVAEGYLDELIRRCLVQVGRKNSTGRVQTVRLHDLMRDLCLSKSKEENFLEIVHLQQIETFLSSMPATRTSNKVRRHAIYLDAPSESVEGRLRSRKRDEGANSDANLAKNGTHLRSLLVFNVQYSWIVPRVLRNTDWQNFKLLRVLSLQKLSFRKKMAKALGNLIHLKYLSLKGASLPSFPSSIRNLGCIQTLDLRFNHRFGRLVICFGINKVIGGMKWLRHLYLPENLWVDNGKVQWDNLSNLETLKHFDGKQWDVQDLAQLGKLRKLQIKNLTSFKELGTILKSSCPISNSLESLILKGPGKTILERICTVEETDLMQLSICQHLHTLVLDADLSNLPGHHCFPSNLTKLTLIGSWLKEDPVPILERLPNLTVLHLEESYEGEEMVFSANGFPELKYLELDLLFNLGLLTVDEGAMPSLASLTISRCEKLKMVPKGLIHISTLKELKVKDMPKEFIQRLQVINGIEGEDFNKVRHVRALHLINC